MTRRVRQPRPFVLPLSNDSRQRGFVKRIPQCGERAAQFGGSQTGAVCESTGNSASGGQSHSARHHGGKSSRASAGICAPAGNHAALANGASGPAANDSPQHIAAAPEHNHHYRSHARQHAASGQSIRELRCCPTSSSNPSEVNRGGPPPNRPPLVSKYPPPQEKLPYERKSPAMEQHPGRPLEPQQKQNLH